MKNLVRTLGLLLIVITLNFFLPRIVFEDPAEPYYAGIPEDAVLLRQQVREEYGFDKPIHEQYFNYLKRTVTLDFGDSHIYKDSVFNVMFKRMPWSMILSVTNFLISITVGVLIGCKAAQNRGKRWDRNLMRASNILTAVPSFWLAMVMIMTFSFIIPIFPYRGAMTAGYTLTYHTIRMVIGVIISIIGATIYKKKTNKKFVSAILLLTGVLISVVIGADFSDAIDILYHSVLPITVLSVGGIVSYAVFVRNSMLHVMSEEYVLTARAKGVPRKMVLYHHTFRTALLPLVTNIAMSFAGIFGGSVLIEKIFSWPGMGQLLIEANAAGDFNLAQAIMLFFAVITIASNFIADIIYQKLDPRVRS